MQGARIAKSVEAVGAGTDLEGVDRVGRVDQGTIQTVPVDLMDPVGLTVRMVQESLVVLARPAVLTSSPAD